MGTWQIVGTAWKVTVKGLGVAGLVAGFNLLVGLVTLPLINQISQATAVGLLVALALGLVQFFVMPLIQGGCLTFANAQVSQGSPPSPLSSFGQGAGRLYGRLLGFEAVMTLMMLLALGALTLVLVGLNLVPGMQASGGVWLVLVAIVPLAIGLYPFLLITAMAPVAILVENQGVFGAIKKGLRTGRAAIGKILLVTFAMLLTSLPLLFVAAIPSLFQPRPAPPPGVLYRAVEASGVVGWQVVAILLRSVATGFATVVVTAAFVQIYRHYAGLTSASA